MAEVFEHASPYNYAVNNPILMVDPDGMAADSTKTVNLPAVVIIRPIKVMEPVSGFWSNVWYGIFPREYDGGYNKYEVNNSGYAQPNIMRMEMPDIGMRNGFNSIYKGVKEGLPYIGKSFNVLKRYSRAERALMEIEPVLNDINEPKLLRAVEQKILEYKKSLGEVANKINAFSPKRKDYVEYMGKAEVWLQHNAPNWKELFK